MRFLTHKNRAEKNISQRDSIFSVKNITSGFTLLELIISITMIVILVGIAIPSFSKFKLNQIHNSEVTNVLSLLNESRTRAASGDSARSYSVSIDTVNKTMTLFRVTTDPGDIEYSEIITLDTKVSLTTSLAGSPANTITFARFTGRTTNTGTITITTSGSGSYSRSSIIRIYSNGLAALD